MVQESAIQPTVVVEVEAACFDGLDEDNDGLVDCEDGDCFTAAVCVESWADCQDEEGDGRSDPEGEASAEAKGCSQVAVALKSGRMVARSRRATRARSTGYSATYSGGTKT